MANDSNKKKYIKYENTTYELVDGEARERITALEQAGGGGTGGAVTSVNGKTGAVTLSAADVGALPASTPIPSMTGYATEAWVVEKGYLTLADLPVYDGGVS